jgi:hypothetical protein
MHWIREIEVDNIDKGPATEAEETSRAAAGLAETLVEESASTFARSACGIGMDELMSTLFLAGCDVLEASTCSRDFFTSVQYSPSELSVLLSFVFSRLRITTLQSSWDRNRKTSS